MNKHFIPLDHLFIKMFSQPYVVFASNIKTCYLHKSIKLNLDVDQIYCWFRLTTTKTQILSIGIPNRQSAECLWSKQLKMNENLTDENLDSHTIPWIPVKDQAKAFYWDASSYSRLLPNPGLLSTNLGWENRALNWSKSNCFPDICSMNNCARNRTPQREL